MTTHYALVLSSGFFLIPAICAFLQGDRFVGGVLGITSLISGAYWWNPVHGLVRNMDLIVSKVSFCIMAYHGFAILTTPFDFTYGLLICGSMCGFYSTACISYRENDPLWWIFHFVFHFQTAYLQWYIVTRL